MKPIVLLGDTGKLEFIRRITKEGFGMMFVERAPRIHYPGMPWAADNGAFAAWKNSVEWDSKAWYCRIDKWRKMEIHPPLFAVVPDLPAQGEKSLEFSRDYVDMVPNEWPKALALQDGMTFQSVKKCLKYFDWLFIGGSDAFKLQAADWVDFARREGKKIHYARASTLEKLEYAKFLGVDSLDSCFPVMDEATVSPFRRYVFARASKLFPVSEVKDEEGFRKGRSPRHPPLPDDPEGMAPQD